MLQDLSQFLEILVYDVKKIKMGYSIIFKNFKFSSFKNKFDWFEKQQQGQFAKVAQLIYRIDNLWTANFDFVSFALIFFY